MVKRTLTAVAAGLLAAALLTFPAMAHGHHRQVAQDTSCPVCMFEGCDETGRHTHDGHDYCGYAHNSGYCDHSCETVQTSGCGGHHHCRY